VRLIAGPMDLTVDVNSTAVLNCTAENPEGAPYPLQFFWRVNATVVDLSNSRITTRTETNGSVSTNFLTLNRTMPSDLGEYLCTVTNFMSGDTVESEDATLFVQCKSF